MFPFFNTLPLHSNGNASSSSASQQVMGNPVNFAPNPLQMQSQMGVLNPQTLIPFGNSSSYFVPNQFFPLQGPQNLNYLMPMNQMNNMGSHHPMPQVLPQSLMGPSKFLNQNLNLGFPNQIKDVNQLFQLQMSNFSTHVVPGNLSLPQNVAFAANTQPGNANLPQNVAFGANARLANLNLPQNLAVVGNTQLAFAGRDGILQNSGNSNAASGTSNSTQQLLGNSGLVHGAGLIPPLQNQKNFHHGPSKLQGSQRKTIANNVMTNNGKPAKHKNFKRNLKYEASGNRIAKSQFQKMQNSKGNINSYNMPRRKGNDNGGARHISAADSALQDQVEEKRSMVRLNYTEKEILQWREERRKNYPTKANIEKKLKEKLTKPKECDKVDQQRRHQLKEILAKQAELGCEVAEIPSYYLSDSEQQVHESKENGKEFNKKGKFQNKFNKRGRFNKNDHFSNKRGSANQNPYSENHNVAKKKRSLANDGSVTHHPTHSREPTLLQKLLSADIKRDKHHLLQAFKFMVMNSFFKDWPKTPLKFPLLMAKETDHDNELIEGKSTTGKSSHLMGGIEQPVGKNDVEYIGSKEKAEGLVIVNFVQERSGAEVDKEEGEIID